MKKGGRTAADGVWEYGKGNKSAAGRGSDGGEKRYMAHAGGLRLAQMAISTLLYLQIRCE